MLANALTSVCLLLILQNFYDMKIINEPSLDNLDKLTNDSTNSGGGPTNVNISPTIRDIGDVGVTSGINF